MGGNGGLTDQKSVARKKKYKTRRDNEESRRRHRLIGPVQNLCRTAAEQNTPSNPSNLGLVCDSCHIFRRIVVETGNKPACGTSHSPSHTLDLVFHANSGLVTVPNIVKNAFLSTFQRFAECCGLGQTYCGNPFA